MRVLIDTKPDLPGLDLFIGRLSDAGFVPVILDSSIPLGVRCGMANQEAKKELCVLVSLSGSCPELRYKVSRGSSPLSSRLATLLTLTSVQCMLPPVRPAEDKMFWLCTGGLGKNTSMPAVQVEFSELGDQLCTALTKGISDFNYDRE